MLRLAPGRVRRGVHQIPDIPCRERESLPLDDVVKRIKGSALVSIGCTLARARAADGTPLVEREIAQAVEPLLELMRRAVGKTGERPGARSGLGPMHHLTASHTCPPPRPEA